MKARREAALAGKDARAPVMRVIKREELAKAVRIAVPFDKEMCCAEARNAERLMMFYLARCDDVATARELVEIFAGLVEKWREKARKLSARRETGV